MMSDRNASASLLPSTREGDDGSSSASGSRRATTNMAHRFRKMSKTGRQLLDSRRKHFIIMAIVVLDVLALLTNIFIQLIACELDEQDEPWFDTVTEALEVTGLVCSTLFLVELLACLLSFGFGYLASWFHLFDSVIIILSFIIDIASRGLTESIGSLIVILRLWRLAKISEELILGSSERTEILEQQMEELGKENDDLRTRLGMEPRSYRDRDSQDNERAA